MKVNSTIQSAPSTSGKVLLPPEIAGVPLLKLVLLPLLALVCFAQIIRASDPIGVFGLIDKVVFEPREGPPKRIQIWGAFSIATNGGNKYKAPEKGYLYYTLPPTKSDVAKIEWADLKASAGKHKVIGFGSRRGKTGVYANNGMVRKPTIKPANPDVYVVGWGLLAMKQRSTQYPPIRDLLALKPSKGKEPKDHHPIGK